MNVNNTGLVRYKTVKVEALDFINQIVFSHIRWTPPNTCSRS